jgi:hypothetical protein
VVTWAAVADDEAARSWDRDLGSLPEPSLVQSFGWGNYKAAQGWTPLRWVARDEDGPPVAMVQALVRVYPCHTVIAWCPGGAVGPVELLDSRLFDQIAVSTHARRLYCRVAFTRGRNDGDVNYLRSHGWAQPRRIVGATSTMVWTLPVGDAPLLAGLGQNWRRNLSRARKRNLRVVQWVDPSPAALAGLFDAMARY